MIRRIEFQELGMRIRYRVGVAYPATTKSPPALHEHAELFGGALPCPGSLVTPACRLGQVLAHRFERAGL